MTAQLSDPSIRWGIGQAVWVVFGFFASLAVILFIVAVAGLPGPIFTIAGYVAETGIIVLAAGPVARHAGGWGAAFGWGAPRWADGGLVLLWLVISYAAKLIIAVVLVLAIPQLHHEFVSNVRIDGATTAALVVAGVFSILVAPPIEELAFRGVALRAVMRRYGFTAAAISTSVLFGLGHAWQEPTPAAALLITVTLAGFGYAQCWLVRYTARLGPAIAVHALSNALAFFLALRTAGILG
ncbi:MAG TPA: type II CAAX endopeptidase family protein [Mycobacteriales bacterium]|nr:type II CAAX endopeptidase family protein [Mycobacteriales bacterium]